MRFRSIQLVLVLVTALTLVLGMTHTASALTAQEVWQTVVDNEAEMSTFQADLSEYSRLYWKSSGTTICPGTATGSAKMKKSATVTAGLFKLEKTSSDSVNMAFNVYKTTDGKSYVVHPACQLVQKRDGGWYEGANDNVLQTSQFSYIGQSTIGGVTVDVIEAPFQTGSATTKARFWVDTLTGVILRRDEYKDSAVVLRYTVDPSDVTQVGSYNVATVSVLTKLDCVDPATEMTTESTLSNIVVNGTIDDSVFTYTIPTGWTVVDKD